MRLCFVFVVICLLVRYCNGQYINCTGKLLTRSACLPDTYAKLMPPVMPTPLKGYFRDIEVIGINLKQQTMTLSLEVSVWWEDSRQD
jgi:hypothetical protein